jgi:Sulfotransferase family
MISVIRRKPSAKEGVAPIYKPVLVFGAPRSGTSMLFQALSTHPELWSLYRESQEVIDKCMAAALQARDSDELRPEDLRPGDAQALSRAFFDSVGNPEAVGAVSARLPLILRARLNRVLTAGHNGAKPVALRIVEKNPQNSFRLRFLERVFPDARFLFITRHPASNLASLYRGWSEPRFRTCRLPVGFALSGHRTRHWHFGRPPGWRDMNGRSLIEICAFQWRAYNEACLRDVPGLTAPVLRVRYEDLCQRPGEVLSEIAGWADLDPGPLAPFASGLPVVNTWSRPHADKWRSLAPQIQKVSPEIADVAARLGYPLPLPRTTECRDRR